MEDRGWRMEDGGWRMEDGGWRMEDGGWRMEDGGWRMEDGGWGMEDGGGRMGAGRRGEDGGWRMEDGGWRMEDGGWRMEDGGWRMEDGGWRMEDGGWRMEDGGWDSAVELRTLVPTLCVGTSVPTLRVVAITVQSPERLDSELLQPRSARRLVGNPSTRNATVLAGRGASARAFPRRAREREAERTFQVCCPMPIAYMSTATPLAQSWPANYYLPVPERATRG